MDCELYQMILEGAFQTITPSHEVNNFLSSLGDVTCT